MSDIACFPPGSEPDTGPDNSLQLAGLARLGACMFGIASSFYLTLSTTPAHLFELGGDAAAGAATTISTFATVVASLFAPRLIVLLGRRMVFAIAAVALGPPCLAVFGDSLVLAETACAVRGLGLGLVFVAAGGLAAGLAPPARRGEVLGVYGLAFSVPAIFAVPLGLWLLPHLGAWILALIANGCALATLLGLGAFPRRQARCSRAATPALPWARLAWPIAVQGCGAAAVGMMITAFAVTAHSAAAGAVAPAMFLHGLATTATIWWGGRLGDRHGRVRLILAGTVLSIGAMLLLCLGAWPAALVAAAAILGAGFGFQQSGTLTLMLARTSADGADGVSAAWNIAYDGGLGLGALAYGCLSPALSGPGASVAIAALVATTTLAGLVCLEARPNRSPFRSA